MPCPPLTASSFPIMFWTPLSPSDLEGWSRGRAGDELTIAPRKTELGASHVCEKELIVR